MPKSVLKAVYDPDLEQLMDRLGVLGAFRSQKLRCASCKDLITWENLHAFFPLGGDVKVVCHKPECVRALIHRLEPPQLDDDDSS